MAESPSGLVDVAETIRRRLCLVLDIDDLVLARRTADELAPWFSTVKIGLELFTAAGPEAVAVFVDRGFDVFCDLKLHDIPHTVGAAARVIGASGARWATVHTSGGSTMLQAAVEGMAEGADRVGAEPPGILGVTVLTSETVAGRHVLEERCALAADSGCEGIVCAAPDLHVTEAWADRLVRVVPGIRMPGGDTHDQARVAAPSAAVKAGADLLVVGRAVTAAPNPPAAAAELTADLAGDFDA
ncbi:MAG: orotidine-5'-phosphate decarboxylase [Acidimicrobiaceae bacterium]|nr:orotidine-5'-phosphate decarboxylase [Acidimicrobiaceae bacterium]HAQ22604.1 orotidine-5'-phosphate decarboxylase [Acidimicrobiaceae bacterium]|tara:strand:+ start:2710 stop:3438 length:729 start_codon:yes stop_codon:yes gene_type:complete